MLNTIIKYKFGTLLCLFISFQFCVVQGCFAAASLPQVSNASARELGAVEQLLSRLDGAVAARYPNALEFYGIAATAPKYAILASHTQITHLAIAPSGALVRVRYDISGKTSQAAIQSPVKNGTLEFWLRRVNDGFEFTRKIWLPPANAMQQLASTALHDWQQSATGILQLVVEYRGGRWIPLRQMRWSGNLASDPVLTQLETAQLITPQAPIDTTWSARQLARYEDRSSGTAHLFLQAGQDGWVGIGSAWHAAAKPPSAAAQQIELQRQLLDGQNFYSASAHREFGKALASAGLYMEASNQLQQASALSPSSVDSAFLAKINNLRDQDPESLAVVQLKKEARIGLDPMHPTYQINALMQRFGDDPTPLAALRLGVEYSQLGDDERAAHMLQQAQRLLAKQNSQTVDVSNRAWVKVLFDHLQERTRDAALKPGNLIRSSLFTVRCWVDDPDTLPLLAALEAAQHTVYADFNIPMNSTEVLLWRNQNDFQRYTTKFSEEAHSEFVTALTLTKLIGTREGPVVLGEEMNIYSSRNTTWFSTVAHEYGHVAVRQMSNARTVPVWLNEGIACVVEGGYQGYKERVHAGAAGKTLLSMDEMLRWQVDGERAFLAYSQANSMVNYIVERWGGNALLQILRLIGNDMPPSQAFSMAIQLTPHQLWQEWRRNGVP